MSPNKLDHTGVFSAPLMQSTFDPALPLSARNIHIGANGLEFDSLRSISLWTEIQMELHSPFDGRRVSCAGVVVDCRGSRQAGFRITLAFMNLSAQTRQDLSSFGSRLRPGYC